MFSNTRTRAWHQSSRVHVLLTRAGAHALHFSRTRVLGRGTRIYACISYLQVRIHPHFAKSTHGCTDNVISHSERYIYVHLFRCVVVILEVTHNNFFSHSALHCSVLSWVISTSTPWRPPTVFLAPSSSSHTCSSCFSSCSTCSWPSLTTLTLKLSPTSPPRRASLRSVTTSRGYVIYT